VTCESLFERSDLP